MVKKTINYLLLIFVILLIFGTGINYYINLPKTFPSEMCFKNKYLVRLGDGGSVYTRIKELYCEVENDIIILEDIE